MVAALEATQTHSLGDLEGLCLRWAVIRVLGGRTCLVFRGGVQTPLSSLRSLGRPEQHGNTGRMLQARLRCLHTCWFLVRKPRWTGRMRGTQVSGTVSCQWGSSCLALIGKLLLCWKQPWEAWSYIFLVMLVVLEEGKPCLHHKGNFQNRQEEVLM